MELVFLRLGNLISFIASLAECATPSNATLAPAFTAPTVGIIYVYKFSEKIYVLHSFHKKTQKTPSKDINLGFNPREAAKLKIKAQLMCQITEWIKEKELVNMLQFK